MKKARFIALVLVAALLLIGAGYAYWSDTLSIKNQVSTGEFKIEFTQGNKIFGASGEKWINKTAAIRENNPNIIDVEISNFYPGRDVRCEFEATNMGDIPVVFKDATVTFRGSERLKNVMKAQVGINGSVTGTFNLDLLEQKIEERFRGCTLNPGEKVGLIATFYLPKEVVNADKVELKTLNIELKYNWTQHNDPAVKDAYDKEKAGV